MKLKIIISVLLITGCTTVEVNPTMCPEFYTYICEGQGAKADCWCEHTKRLEEKLKFIHQRAHKSRIAGL